MFRLFCIIVVVLATPSAFAEEDHVVEPFDDAEGRDVGVSVTGNASGRIAAISLLGSADSTDADDPSSCGEAISVAGNATGCEAVTILGDASGRFEAISVMGDATCWEGYRLCIAASGTGNATGNDIPGVSLCQTLRALGRPEPCL